MTLIESINLETAEVMVSMNESALKLAHKNKDAHHAWYSHKRKLYWESIVKRLKEKL